MSIRAVGVCGSDVAYYTVGRISDCVINRPIILGHEEAALRDPLPVGIRACWRAGLEVGDRVLVTGARPVGILAALAARAFGSASVTLSDVSDFRVELGARTRPGVSTAAPGCQGGPSYGGSPCGSQRFFSLLVSEIES